MANWGEPGVRISDGSTSSSEDLLAANREMQSDLLAMEWIGFSSILWHLPSACISETAKKS
jgi:hypothetical protein